MGFIDQAFDLKMGGGKIFGRRILFGYTWTKY